MLKLKYLAICLFFLLTIQAYSTIPNLENRDKNQIKSGILDTYLRSMGKWDIPFLDLLENKSGAACIQWSKMSENFLKEGMFDALGYSQNIPNKKASQIAAIAGCKKMKDYYKLGNTCKCEVIITNNQNQVILPIIEFDKKKEFKEAVEFYKNENYQEAHKKFLKLSELGDSISQHNLSIILYEGKGFPQNFNKAYYWALSSNLYGEKRAAKLVKKNSKRLSKEEINQINEELRDNLEKLVIEEGVLHAIVPLAKWFVTIPKDIDYASAYKWLSVASAFNIKNTKPARDSIFKNMNKDLISSVQVEANEIFDSVKKIKNKPNGGN